MFARLLDAVFPPSCVGCRRGAWPFCARCAATLVAPDAPPPEAHPADSEPRGGDPPSGIDAIFAAYRYEGAARRAVLNLKFSGARQVARAFAAPMVAALRAAAMDGLAIDVVTWAPLGPRRRRERGFDQGRLLAGAVAAELGLPVVRLLDRTRETPPQARRGAAERRAAMRGAFAARRPAPASVLLVDDVVTTGATAAACASALSAAGARRVVVLAAARAASPSAPRAYTRAGSVSGSVVARGASPR